VGGEEYVCSEWKREERKRVLAAKCSNEYGLLQLKQLKDSLFGK
jgi:hypothetical protein